MANAQRETAEPPTGNPTAQKLIEAIRPLTGRVRTDATAVKKTNGDSLWTNQSLTEARLRAHVTGKKARGVCPIQEGQSEASVALLDLDAHHGETPWPEMTAAAETIMAELERRGMRPVPWRSSGGNGIHLYLIWDEPQDARSVRAELTDALEAAGYRDGTGGVAQGQAEIFPRQNHVPNGKKGSQFILPLAGKSVPLEPMLNLEPLERSEAPQVRWPASDPVPLHDPPPASESTAGGVEVDIETLDSALKFIPNSGEEELNYDDWRNIIFAIHHTAPDENGRQVAHEFSARSSKYDPEFLDNRVWPYIRSNRTDAVTGATVLQRARQNGWTEPDELILRDFDFVDSEDSPPIPRIDLNKQGYAHPTLGNLTRLLTRPDLTGRRVRFDQFRDEILTSPPECNEWEPVRDAHLVAWRVDLEEGRHRGPLFRPVGRETMRDAVHHVAEQDPFDSAITWLTEEVPAWDGVPRLSRFLAWYFSAEDDSYSGAVSRYIWTALAGRVLAPGCKADMMPVLVGRQGAGKSSGVAAMVPSAEHYFEVDFRAREDDLARRMRGRLIGEVGELRGLHSREIEHIKTFITRTHEHWIPKYREFAVTFPRRCIFIGTTNDQEFLADETGNRRFLPVNVASVDGEAIERDRPQLWAEARERYRERGVEWAEAERLAAGRHDAHRLTDAWEEPILSWLDSRPSWDELAEEGATNWERAFTTNEVARLALGRDPAGISPAEFQRLGRVIRGLGFEKKRQRRNGQLTHVWEKANA